MNGVQDEARVSRGQWMALTAALLGWMFDGFEMGLFPLVARPALRDLLGTTDEKQVGLWFGVATASFLVGAATGGVVFGWLGDRLGRVRAMTLSVLTYAVFSGLCGLSTSAAQVAALRFLSALGMGGEWSLGVALVMEIWPNRSRAMLAGLIGAVANVGHLLPGAIGYGLARVLGPLHGWLVNVGLPSRWVDPLLAHEGWRVLLFLGAAPALLTFFIRLFVPESSRWEEERDRGATGGWATRDLLGVCVGAGGAVAMIYLWAQEFGPVTRLTGSAVALAVVTAGYLYPVFRYLQRSVEGVAPRPDVRGGAAWPTVRRMLLGACLSGVPLIGTWAAIQLAQTWAHQLAGGVAHVREYTQISGSSGAVIGTLVAAFLGDWLGRRAAYSVLCLASLASALAFFQLNDHFGPAFLAMIFVAGACTASFYGWLPLYLPELFATRVRATGQGFSFNFGRILAAVGVLQTGNLVGLFHGSYPQACSIMCLVYVVGLALIWLAPETHGKPLPA
jgi:MFS family permease